MKNRIGAIATGLLLLAMAMPAAAGEPVSLKAPVKLSKHDRSLLAKAETKGQKQVTVLAVFEPQTMRTAEQGLLATGSVVRYSDAELGYIRASVPIKHVESIARMAGLQALSLDEVIPLDLPRPEKQMPLGAVEAPGESTPAENAYMPTRDIGAPQFVAEHPTFDGRGVVIGIVDTGVDLLTPELQEASLINGQPARKIIDWVTYTDPLEDDDPTWINMETEVRASGGTFTYGEVTYTVPRNSTYRFGIFDERDARLGGEINHDVNRDGNPEGSSGQFALLWDFPRSTVYVDTNQNHDFSDDLPMRDYKINHDVGIFGVDDPATALRETVPFVVQTDPRNKYVNIGIVSDSHGTHVAGIAAGNGFFGGAFDGAAPGAQIVSVRACLFASGCTAHALIEGMIYLARDARVDVINMSIGGLPALNDGNNARAIIYNRIIDHYGVQMFISAGNSGPGINTVGDPSIASQVMSVGAYVHKETWLSNYGAAVNKDDGIFTFSSRGPSENGGFKPNILAPGAAVSAIPAWLAGSPVAGTYALPPGYGMYNGTSMAAPQATGGAALLLSAAKQSRLKLRSENLRDALISSARFLEHYAAHDQGMGLMNVPGAWSILAQRPGTIRIEATAPVNTVLSQYLERPNMGPGLYEREGWAPGATGTRDITLVRKSGNNNYTTYNMSLLGNDGTFALPAGTITLRLNRPETLAVTISPATSGVHSAILVLDDPLTPAIDHQTMLTVVAAEQFSVDNNFSAQLMGAAERADQKSFFFYVPASTPGFHVAMNLMGGRARVHRYHPYGLPLAPTSYTNGPADFGVMTSNPAGGVWEVNVETSRAAAAEQSDFKLTSAILGVEMTPTTWMVEGAQVGNTYSQTFGLTNRFGAFTGAATGTVLGSAAAGRPTIDTTTPQLFDVQVEPGSNRISARIGNAADTRSDLDLYLFDCTSGSCILRATSAGSSSEEALSYANPAAGLWKVYVDPYAIPEGNTAYDYLDVFSNPMFGTVNVVDADAVRSHGATWSAEAGVRADASPATGRFLQGFVEVRSGGAVLSAVEVRLQNVAP